MRRNKRQVKALLLAFAVSTMTSFAQTPQERQEISNRYDKSKLTQLQSVFKDKEDKRRAQAINMASLRGWEILKANTDGSVDELIAVSRDGQPIYYTVYNEDAARSTRANHLNIGGSLGLSLDGQNMTAHVWDGGPTRVTHQEFDGPGGNNRVSINDGVAALNGNSFHAQHVTGTIVASGVQAAAKGMAPQADALTHDWNNDLSEATAEAAAGMLLSNHSYGFRASLVPDWYFGAYIDESRDWDNLMYNSPFYLMVVAAGNDGNDNSSNASPLDGASAFDKLTGHSTSKNNMVVANGQDANVNNDGTLNSITINSGSSEGPTDDYRIKPDITGNGTGVYSTYDNSDVAYNSISGTSMASPNVTGTLLLLQQHYNNVNGNFMRAATLKGLALHTADDAGISGPDAVYGWGLMNAKVAAEAISDNGNGAVIDELSLANGASYTLNVDSDGSSPLMASISWTDPAGTANTGTANVTTPVLVNDLDIRITKGGTTYNPYRLTGVNSNGTGDNTVDPYERIDVSGASGAYTITVTHKGSLSSGSQNFSLVVTGVTGTPPVCNATTPSGLSSSSVGTSTATLSWNAVANATYDLRYRPTGGSWTTTSVSGTTTDLNGLASGTQYEAQVRSTCPDNSTSAYSSSVNFTTGTVSLSCTTTISTFPYGEGFESNDGWNQLGGDDGNWVRDSGGTPSSNTGPGSAVEGTFYMFLEASTNSSPGQIGNNATAILESNCFDLSGATGATFSFQHHMYGTDVGSLTIQASNDGAVWTNLWTLSGNQGNQWNAVDVDMNAYVGGDVKIRIVGTTGAGWSSDIAVDDLAVTTSGGGDTEAPSVPANLAASNVTQTTLTLNWDASSDNVGVTGYDVYQGSSNIGTVASTSANITGLAAGTSYTFSVRAKDAAGNESAASAVLNVTTQSAGMTCSSTETLPYAEGFETNDGWTQASGDDGNWVRDSGGTPSSNTGPGSAAEGSFYMFLEASSNSSPGQIGSNATAILESPCFDLSGESAATFSFQYHMYGNNVGSLTAQASTDGTNWTNVWTLSGNQGNAWATVNVDLASYLGGDVKLRLVGTTGNGWSSDIAIDDLSVSAGSTGGNVDVTLTIVLDDYPEETSWEIRDGATVVASGGTYGSQPDRSTVTEVVSLPVGCYDFVISDVYGDGICCTYGPGSYSLVDGSTTLASGGSFGSSETSNFCVGGATTSSFVTQSSSEGTPVSVTMYPNYNVADRLTVTSTRREVSYSITNLNGQTVDRGELVGGRVDVTNLNSGMYMIHLKDEGGKSVTKKFVKD
ncbi:MAG: S8 family serine peptidase [Ekhidna sp.]